MTNRHEDRHRAFQREVAEDRRRLEAMMREFEAEMRRLETEKT